MSKILELLPSNSSLDYNCKFCGRPGHVEFHDPKLSPAKSELMNFHKLVPALCCDRCGQYERRRRDLVYSMFRAATKLITLRILRPESNDSDRIIFEQSIKLTFERLTKRFGQIVADFWNKEYIWEPDLARTIMQDPEPKRVQHLLNAYVRAIKHTHSSPALAKKFREEATI
jgi:hypothetical protein